MLVETLFEVQHLLEGGVYSDLNVKGAAPTRRNTVLQAHHCTEKQKTAFGKVGNDP